jgi:isoquinoline 1-oxidoreductase alpha subunit
MDIKINNVVHSVNVDDDMPLLWLLRDILDFTGTKYGCGVGICGTCIVLMNDMPVRSCITPVTEAVGKNIITIEGLSPDASHKLQLAWIQAGVTQCGYCQPGQIMSAAGLLLQNSNPTDDDIDAAMQDNICRCGTYNRVREAIHLATTL